MIPLVFVISTQVLFYSISFWKWVITGIIILLFIPFSKLLEKFGVLHLSSHWNVFYTLIMFCSYALLSWLMGWFMILLDKKEGEKA
jgi:Ni/Fe-hydrogenase subunit HybB-like protein